MARLTQCGQHPASFLSMQISFFRILVLGFKADREESEVDDERIPSEIDSVVRLGISCLNSYCKHILWIWANNLVPFFAPKSLNICLYLNRASLLHFHLNILRTLVKCTIKIRMPWSPTAHCYFCRGAVEPIIFSLSSVLPVQLREWKKSQPWQVPGDNATNVWVLS